ncbi:MAG: hypothetical protein DHS20C21_13720 [Gemmatimonadota bacterium]|nr:MAG: hypothetical protein DHS20C21_13720 [Gemmatimonadota bacterium]
MAGFHRLREALSPVSDEESYYSLVACELESGEIRKGLWAKALAKNSMNHDVARGQYVELRVEQLKRSMPGPWKSVRGVVRIEEEMAALRTRLREVQAELEGIPRGLEAAQAELRVLRGEGEQHTAHERHRANQRIGGMALGFGGVLIPALALGQSTSMYIVIALICGLLGYATAELLGSNEARDVGAARWRTRLDSAQNAPNEMGNRAKILEVEEQRIRAELERQSRKLSDVVERLVRGVA